MAFLDRRAELGRLDGVRAPGLAVVWGRRRVGKTRLLVEWNRRRGGIYTVADQSAEPVQRRYFAEAVATKLAGFADVEYPDWRALFRAVAREAARGALRGPLIVDELPYLVAASPALPSVLQSWVDHDGKDAGLLLVLAGSSQRMMQGLVLDAAAPLYGRAQQALALKPLLAGWIKEGIGLGDALDRVRAFSVWGGVPWYWELAAPFGPDLDRAVDHLVLDPMGPLHAEPDRQLLEEQPSAAVLRPLLDAIGAGAHRLSEIAGRIAQPATSLSRPLNRLVELGLVRRDQPFGAHERSGKRALYRIDDPFFSFWFRVVAPHRGLLTVAPARGRIAVWHRHSARLHAETWEDLARQAVPLLPESSFHGHGPFQPAARYWGAGEREWDVVAASVDKHALLLGEAKWHDAPIDEAFIERAAGELMHKGTPGVAEADGRALVHALFVPRCPPALKRRRRPIAIIDADDVLAALR